MLVHVNKRKLCKKCHQTGEVRDDSGKFKFKTCPDCQGRGWVPKEDSNENTTTQ